MAGQSDTITAYILAKDFNRPWLMQRAFAADARLDMVVRTEAITFPPAAQGVAAITEILVRQFSRENENVYTFCLAAPPQATGGRFSCDWLVGMSRRESGQVRVGCGRYDWEFDGGPDLLVRKLRITIAVMQVLTRDHLEPVMRWLAGLPHPWCPAGRAMQNMPPVEDLKPIADFLAGRADRR